MPKKTLAVLAVLAPLVALAGDAQMSEGLWEITTAMDIPGMPFKLPPQKVQRCYTKSELESPDGAVPKQKDCKLDQSKRAGNKLTWKVTCTGKNPGTGEGELVFKGPTEYEGWMKFDSQGQVMTTKYSAKRLGACQ